MVMAEFEPYTDAILVEYGVTPAAVLDVLTGAFDPEGLLPIQIPKDMETVEQQKKMWHLTWNATKTVKDILTILDME